MDLFPAVTNRYIATSTFTVTVEGGFHASGNDPADHSGKPLSEAFYLFPFRMRYGLSRTIITMSCVSDEALLADVSGLRSRFSSLWLAVA